MGKAIRTAAVLAAVLAAGVPYAIAAQVGPPADPLAAREAEIWYLGHAGWAVRTAHHVLIFDYAPRANPRAPAQAEDARGGPALAQGVIDPRELPRDGVIVFVSHAHGDHYDPAVLEWKRWIPEIRYVFGWDIRTPRQVVRIDRPRKSVEVDGVRVSTVFHDFDRIPESAFLVEADGLAVFHSGDHGATRGMENPVFRGNVEYLAGLGTPVDLLFTPAFGGHWDLIDRLKPAVAFPMHGGGREQEYARFAKELRARLPGVQAGAATRLGQCFRYAKGRLGPCRPPG